MTTERQLQKTIDCYTRYIKQRIQQIAEQKGYAVEYIKAYTETSYGDGIRNAASLFWKEGSRGNFLTRINTLIKFGLNDAWTAGAKAAGVERDEFEDKDTEQINSLVTEEKSHVRDLLDFMDELANSGKPLSAADYRLDMWAGRWKDVYNQALVWFGGKLRLKWVYGATEHCDTCRRLNGIIAWANEWEKSNIRPQSQRLACHGYNCECRLEPTTQRRSPKALARIMVIIGG